MQAKLGLWKLWVCKGERLRSVWQLLLPQISCRLKGVGDLSLPESAASQAWHFAVLSPTSQ